MEYIVIYFFKFGFFSVHSSDLIGEPIVLIAACIVPFAHALCMRSESNCAILWPPMRYKGSKACTKSMQEDILEGYFHPSETSF